MKEQYEDRIVHRANPVKRAQEAKDWLKDLSLANQRSQAQTSLEPRRMNFWSKAGIK